MSSESHATELKIFGKDDYLCDRKEEQRAQPTGTFSNVVPTVGKLFPLRT